MKRSIMVNLIVSGALSATVITGCDKPTRQAEGDWQSEPLTNNTYRPGSGYWHAPYHGWYPYPYNYYRPGFGYYHGGLYTPAPDTSPVTVSAAPSNRSGHAGASRSSGRISRGGFGGSAHSAGS